MIASVRIVDAGGGRLVSMVGPGSCGSEGAPGHPCWIGPAPPLRDQNSLKGRLTISGQLGETIFSLVFALAHMTSRDTQISDALLAELYRGKPADARALGLHLSMTDRARLAIFCNSKAHLRAHGREIAAICTEASLQQEGGLAGVMLLRQIHVEPDSWGGLARSPAVKKVSLGGAGGKGR